MTISNDLKKKLKAKAKLLDPVVRIGKNGITENMIVHIKMLVRKRQLVKIKFLRSFSDSQDTRRAAKELAEKTGAEIVDQIGFNLVLHRLRK
jgi:RNA-binding protein